MKALSFIVGRSGADNRLFSGFAGVFRVAREGNSANSAARYGPLFGFSLYLRRPMAGWQSGYAEDCKSSYSGSIPLPASSLLTT